MSIGQDFINANPFDPWLDTVSREEQISGELAREAARKFINWVDSQYPGEWHPSLENAALIEKFMEVNDVCPSSLRNYKISFIFLRSEGLFEKWPVESDEPEEAKTPYSKPTTLRIQKSPEELEAERAEIAGLRALDNTPRSQKKVDVGVELRRAYQQSLQQNKNGGKKRHMSPGESRAKAAETFAELAGKRESGEMNLWSARLQFNQDSSD